MGKAGVKYQISNETISIVVSDTGAEMNSIMKDGLEYLWYGDSKYWSEQSPVLFPYVGRFTNGRYTLNHDEYEMDIHGFARKLEYSVVRKEKDKIEFELLDNEKTRKCYPYRFSFRIGYVLEGNIIKITYHVRNKNEEMMYFGIGGHPGFNVPLEAGLDFSDYYLEFSGKSRPERVGHTDRYFLSGIDEEFILEDARILKLEHSLFDDDAIVLKNISDEVTLKTDKGQRQVKVSYPQFPYLGLWHAPKTKAPYLCIEPWTSLTSRQDIIEEIRYKSDLIRLGPNQEYVNQWSIMIE